MIIRAKFNKHVSSINTLFPRRRRGRFCASSSIIFDRTGRSQIGTGRRTVVVTDVPVATSTRNTTAQIISKVGSGPCLGVVASVGLPTYNYFLNAKSLFSTSSSSSKENDNGDDDNDDHRPYYDSYKMLESIVASSSIAKKVERITHRYDDIMFRMINGNTSSDDDNNNDNNESNDTESSSQVGVGEEEAKELSSLSQIAKLYNEFKLTVDEMNEMHQFMMQAEQEKEENDDNDDEQDELIKECQDEIQHLEQKLNDIGTKVIEAIVPHDENDFNTDAILELRAGTGGDEASLFCGELMSCYEKVASSKGWMFEVLVLSKTDLKGVKEAAISISSNSGGGGGGGFYSDYEEDKPLGPYGYFKFESGVHRVQRVPINDVRIHTSAASVAVLPAPNSTKGKADDLPKDELRIETMRASGAGGQHVNTTDSAVRITHIPTGITASIQDERSQHKNKAKAIKLITARVRDKQEAEEARKRGDAKASLMGGGDRSERVRTYNFPQDRVTDHRCKHSEFGIEKLLSGGSGGGDNMEDSGLVGIFLPHMKKMERAELMKSLEEEETESVSRRGKKNQ